MAVNEFKTDTHRRVAGMLQRPRSAEEIAVEFNRHDPYVADDARDAEGVAEYLADLEADGLAVNLGELGDPEKALAAQDKSKKVIDFTGDRRLFVATAESENRYPFLDKADHWVRTTEAQERLIGTAPGEEPEDE